ncbi:MAG: hypothetical protein R3F36_06365 [Candidatus Competibacteraceae bacterium]
MHEKPLMYYDMASMRLEENEIMYAERLLIETDPGQTLSFA